MRRKGPLWSKVLTTTYYLTPEYGIALGKVITGAKKTPATGQCPNSSLDWQMGDWLMECSDDRAFAEGCERGQYYRYEYETNISRANALWKYSIHADSRRTDLGDCVVKGRQTVGTIWGSHKELYPLLDVPEGKLEDGSARQRYNVIVRSDGKCVFRANKFERYRLEAAEVEEPKIEYSAPFKVTDQLTPHGPSVGRIEQNQPDATMCLVKGNCDYPISRTPCVGQNHVEVRQTMVITQTEGVKHRLAVEVTSPGGPCDPIVIADTYLEEVAKVHGPTSTKLLYNVALHHSTVTVRAGDTWLEYSVSKNAIRPSTSRSLTTRPYQSTGMTGSPAGLAMLLVGLSGCTALSRGRSSL